jgi:hypothetical protein
MLNKKPAKQVNIMPNSVIQDLKTEFFNLCYLMAFLTKREMTLTKVVRSKHRRRLRVASRATASGPALEGVPRFRPKLVHKQKKKLWIMKKLNSGAKSQKLI